MKKTINELNDARAQKALDQLCHFDSGVMTLRQYQCDLAIASKSTWTDYRSRRKINLENPLLENPKTTYYLEWPNGDHVSMIAVPKLVYDLYDVPETIHDNPDSKAEWEKAKRQKSERSMSFSNPWHWNH